MYGVIQNKIAAIQNITAYCYKPNWTPIIPWISDQSLFIT